MADAVSAEYALRARVKPERRELASLSNKERGLRAAIEVLQDGTSPKTARTKCCLLYTSDAADE